MITELTAAQQESIAYYQQKWQQVYLSTESINRRKVAKVLEDVYKPESEYYVMPEVIFFDSPYAAFRDELRVTNMRSPDEDFA